MGKALGMGRKCERGNMEEVQLVGGCLRRGSGMRIRAAAAGERFPGAWQRAAGPRCRCQASTSSHRGLALEVFPSHLGAPTATHLPDERAGPSVTKGRRETLQGLGSAG